MVDENITATEFRNEVRTLLKRYFEADEIRSRSTDELIELALREEEIKTFVQDTNKAVEPEDRGGDPRFVPQNILRAVAEQVRSQVTPQTSVDDVTGDRPADQLEERDRPVSTTFEYESVDARVFIGSSEYDVIKYKSTADISNSANFGEAVVIAGENTSNIETPDYDKEFEAQVRVTVNANDQNIPRNNQMYNEWITLFRGYINNFRSKAHDQWMVQFSDFSSDIIYEHSSIQNTNVRRVTDVVEQLVSNVSGTPNQVIFSGFDDDPDRFLEVIEPDELSLEDASQREVAGVGFRQLSAVETQTSDSTRVTGVVDEGESISADIDGDDSLSETIDYDGGQPLDGQVKLTRERQKTADLLDELATISNAFWWVDRNNNFIFGKPDTQIRDLLFVTDASDGGLSPPYRSVVVIGDGVIGGDGTSDVDNIEEAGWGYDHLESNTTPVVTARIAGVSGDEPQIEPNEVQEPIFEYKNTDIKTPKQLKNTALKLAEELAQQLEGGEITLVGRPDIRLLDQVLMPAFLTPSDEAFRYTVGGVKHRINSQDGFITKVQPMHVIGENNEIEEVRDALEIRTDEQENSITEAEQVEADRVGEAVADVGAVDPQTTGVISDNVESSDDELGAQERLERSELYKEFLANNDIEGDG